MSSINRTSRYEFEGSDTTSGLVVTNAADIGSDSAVFQPNTNSTTFFQVKDAAGNTEFRIDTANDAILWPATSKLGTIQGSYNLINGDLFAAKTGYVYCFGLGASIAGITTANVYYNNIVGANIGDVVTGDFTYNHIVGTGIANKAITIISRNNIVGSSLVVESLGSLYNNNIVGYNIADTTTGNLIDNNLVGDTLANSAATGILYNNLVGYNLASSSTGNVYYNNLIGSNIISVAEGNVTNNNMVGGTLANAATGTITNATLYGSSIANAITGNVDATFSAGYLNLYNTTNETNLARVIALPYEALRESSASDLDDAIAIGYRAGYQNAYNNPALFGRAATATANQQVVIGSSFYTGGILLDGEVDFDSLKPITFVYEGDSLTNDSGDWPEYLVTKSGFFGRGRQVNVATGGDTVADMVTDYATEVAPYAPDQRNQDEGYYFLLGGTNDINAARSAANIYTDLQTLWAGARADGFKVIAFTVLPSTSFDGGEEAVRVALNALIISDPTLYDYLIRPDITLHDASDGTYYSDGTHLTAAGSSLVADLVYQAMYKDPYFLIPYTDDSTVPDLILNPWGHDTYLWSAQKLHFRDSAIGVYSQADTYLDVFADGGLRIGDSSAGAPTNYTKVNSTGDVSFAGSAGFYPRVLNQSAEPAAGTGATQCDTGEMVVWTDTDDSKCYLCYNHGGTVKTAELI